MTSSPLLVAVLDGFYPVNITKKVLLRSICPLYLSLVPATHSFCFWKRHLKAMLQKVWMDGASAANTSSKGTMTFYCGRWVQIRCTKLSVQWWLYPSIKRMTSVLTIYFNGCWMCSGVSTTVMNGSHFTQQILASEEPDSKNGVSPATALEALLFFDRFVNLRWSVTGKQVNAGQTSQNCSLVAAEVQLVASAWNEMTKASSLCMISQLAALYLWIEKGKVRFFVPGKKNNGLGIW